MSTITLSTATALVVVDVQQAFTLPPYHNPSSTPECLPNVSKMISTFRSAALPVIHIRHHSIPPTSPFNPEKHPEGVLPLPEALDLPGETIFIKNVNSSFIGTGLEQHLRDSNIKTLVIIGLTTSHCVSTTVRMAGNLGWEVYVPRDATAMYAREAAPGAPAGLTEFDAETMHEVALAELHGEFATVVTTDQVMRAVESVRK